MVMTGDSQEYFSFNVKFKNTPENFIVWSMFKNFAKYNTKDGYLLAIKLLLDRNDALRMMVLKNDEFEGKDRK